MASATTQRHGRQIMLKMMLTTSALVAGMAVLAPSAMAAHYGDKVTAKWLPDGQFGFAQDAALELDEHPALLCHGHLVDGRRVPGGEKQCGYYQLETKLATWEQVLASGVLPAAIDRLITDGYGEDNYPGYAELPLYLKDIVAECLPVGFITEVQTLIDDPAKQAAAETFIRGLEGEVKRLRDILKERVPAAAAVDGMRSEFLAKMDAIAGTNPSIPDVTIEELGAGVTKIHTKVTSLGDDLEGLGSLKLPVWIAAIASVIAVLLLLWLMFGSRRGRNNQQQGGNGNQRQQQQGADDNRPGAEAAQNARAAAERAREQAREFGMYRDGQPT